MLPLTFLLLTVVAVVVAMVVLWRRRGTKFGIHAIGTEAAVGTGGLSGKHVGYVRWQTLDVPARIAPHAGRDVLASGTAVIIAAIEDGVALVVVKN